MALGLNDKGQVVGVYMVGTAMHGFVYNSTNGHFHSVDDPKGVGSTTINGINNGRLSVLSRLERTHGRLYRHAFVGQRRRFPVFKNPRSRRDGYRQPADSGGRATRRRSVVVDDRVVSSPGIFAHSEIGMHRHLLSWHGNGQWRPERLS